jgi:hypothetical protein
MKSGNYPTLYKNVEFIATFVRLFSLTSIKHALIGYDGRE